MGLLSTEYLLLGGLIVGGSAVGLSAIKDATNQACHDYADKMHIVLDQSYTVPSQQTSVSSKPGSRYQQPPVGYQRFQQPGPQQPTDMFQTP